MPELCFEPDVSRFPPTTKEYIKERIAAQRPANGNVPEMAIGMGTLWRNGRKISVQFIGGTPTIRDRVKASAATWTQHANIKFEYVESGGEIRIAFVPGGSWSYLGVEALRVPANHATMNLGWLKDTTAQSEVERVVLHEFGHALGCIHEHQSPANGIPWNVAAVNRYYSGPPNDWSEAMIRSNVLDKVPSSMYSAYDGNSIMQYPIPAELVTNPSFVRGWNSKLSTTDVQFIQRAYPFPAKPANPTR